MALERKQKQLAMFFKVRREQTSPRKEIEPEESVERYGSLKLIEDEPPRSLAAVHRGLGQALQDITVELQQLEHEFYNGGGMVEEVAKWKFLVNNVLRASGFSDIWSSKQLDELERMSISSTSSNITGRVVASDVKKMRECVQHIREFLPNRFDNLLKQLKRTLHLFTTYCRSFYDSEKDPFLDTASNYEKSRANWTDRIQTVEDLIPALVQKFESEKGVSVSRFSAHIREMAQQLGASHIHFLFLFPEACQGIRQTVSDLRHWLQTDVSYAEYISNDLQELGQRQVQSEKQLRETQERSYKQKFKMRQAEAEWSKLNERVQELAEKEDSLLVEEEQLAQRITDSEVDVNIKHYQQDELRKNVAQMHPDVYYETLEKLAADLKNIEVDLPRSKRRIQHVRAKLFWVKQKRQRLAELEKAQEEARVQRQEAEQERQEVQLEHDNLVNCVSTLKRIYRFKSTSDALQRLHYQLPLTVQRNVTTPDTSETAAPLIRACSLIAENIERDWIRLYHVLPFTPTRGDATVEADVLRVQDLAGRQGYETQANLALARWRRHNKRAKVSDLMSSLRSIGRADIARTMHNVLYPKAEPRESVLEETKKPPVSADLLPYYRMIERFDLLRAQGKI